MAQITIASARAEAAKRNWQITSNSYVNLQTALTFKCEHGHEFELTLAQFRDNAPCIECLKSTALIDLQSPVRPKPAGAIRLLGCDTATHTTGFGLFEKMGDSKTLIKCGTVEVQGDQTARVSQLCAWVREAIQRWEIDIVGTEGLFLDLSNKYSNIEIFRVLAGAQGAFRVAIYDAGAQDYVIHPSTWRAFNHIKVSTRMGKKIAAQQLVKTLYEINAGEDEAEGICLGRYLAFSHPQIGGQA